MLRRVRPALVLTIAIGVWAPASVAERPRAGETRRDNDGTRFEFAEPHMGTTARVVLFAATQSKARKLADRAFARIAELDARLSDYRPDSELMTLGRAAGGPPVPVGEDLFTVLSAAQHMATRTEGAFDVTVGPLSRIWRRARVTGERPDAASIAAARTLVGYHGVELSPDHRVRLAKAGMLLDLGGIAKGYAADQALTALRDAGIGRALVAIGGDIAAGDAPPGKDGWMVDVAPLGPAALARLPRVTLRAAAISTSGDAEQFVTIDGTRFSHLLRPSTGQPLEGRRGVTIVASNGMTADALATAVSVLETTRGLALVDETQGAAALIVAVTPDGVREYRSSRWRQEMQNSER